MPVIVNAIESVSQYIVESNNAFLELWPHRYDFIYAPHPGLGDRPQWETETRYPLSDRLIEQGAYLYGVRFGPQTRYCLLDIDAGSQYHLSQDPLAMERIVTALEPLGLVSYVACTSSYSQGLHLYFPLDTPVSSWKLSAVVTGLLENQGLKCVPGQLEVFPNRKLFVLDGTPNLFNAHRLPLQAGSYLLNSQLEPIASSQERFVHLWQHCEQQNSVQIADIDRLLKQIRRRTYRVSQKADKFLNDLNAEIEVGWTGNGQTNYLLGRITMRCYIFHHVLKGGQPLSGEALVKEIVAVATGLPGYREWCRHQHDIEQRAEEWARCIENSHYFPYGAQQGKYKAKLTTQVSETDASVAQAWNQQRSQAAQVKIQNVVEQLWTQGKLAATTTARFQQLVAYGIGGSTLYKYKSFWHPNLWKTPQTPQPSNEGAAATMAPPVAAAHAPSLLPGEDRNASGGEPLRPTERPDPAEVVRNPQEQSAWQQAYAQLKQRQLQRKMASPPQPVPPTAQFRLGEPRLVERMADYLRSRDPILMKEGLAWLVQQDEWQLEQLIPADMAQWLNADCSDPRLAILIEVCQTLLILGWSPPEMRQSLVAQFGRSAIATLSIEDLGDWCKCLPQHGRVSG